jgi:hypothetical protein
VIRVPMPEAGDCRQAVCLTSRLARRSACRFDPAREGAGAK